MSASSRTADTIINDVIASAARRSLPSQSQRLASSRLKAHARNQFTRTFVAPVRPMAEKDISMVSAHVRTDTKVSSIPSSDGSEVARLV